MAASLLDLRITRIIKETDSVIRLELEQVNKESLPVYQAGAHIAVKLPSGLVRQYSLSRLPTTGKTYEIAVLREPNSRGGSAEIHQLKEGAVVQAWYPQNQFSLTNPRAKTLLMAAGIGITPLIPMAQMLHKTGADFALHYSAKNPQQAAYYTTLKEMPFASRVQFHFSETEHRADIKAVLKQHSDKRDIYVCGPNAYIDQVLDVAQSLGWPDTRLHREYFSGQLAPNMGESGEGSFQVKVASSGEVFDVEVGVSITETLEANGIDIPVSCEEGWCGTCMTRLLEGVPDHRDTFLSNDERASGDVMMPCCSRALSKYLVLDL